VEHIQDDVRALGKEVARLEAQMYKQARNLDFEAAAATRDLVARLKKRLLQLEA
jgi:excinuclease UvrABC helicase subunit UvrB